MDVLIVFIIELLIEIFIQLVIYLAAEFLCLIGKEKVKISKKRAYKPALGLVVVAVFGCISGFVMTLVFPGPIIGYSIYPGISLITAPVLTGYFTWTIGNRRRESGRKTTVIVTFWGGAVYAFAAALVRFLMI